MNLKNLLISAIKKNDSRVKIKTNQFTVEQNLDHSRLNPEAPVFTPALTKLLDPEQDLENQKLTQIEQQRLNEQLIKDKFNEIESELKRYLKQASNKRNKLITLPDSINIKLIEETVIIDKSLPLPKQLSHMLNAITAIKKNKI